MLLNDIYLNPHTNPSDLSLSLSSLILLVVCQRGTLLPKLLAVQFFELSAARYPSKRWSTWRSVTQWVCASECQVQERPGKPCENKVISRLIKQLRVVMPVKQLLTLGWSPVSKAQGRKPEDTVRRPWWRRKRNIAPVAPVFTSIWRTSTDNGAKWSIMVMDRENHRNSMGIMKTPTKLPWNMS